MGPPQNPFRSPRSSQSCTPATPKFPLRDPPAPPNLPGTPILELRDPRCPHLPQDPQNLPPPRPQNFPTPPFLLLLPPPIFGGPPADFGVRGVTGACPAGGVPLGGLGEPQPEAAAAAADLGAPRDPRAELRRRAGDAAAPQKPAVGADAVGLHRRVETSREQLRGGRGLGRCARPWPRCGPTSARCCWARRGRWAPTAAWPCCGAGTRASDSCWCSTPTAAPSNPSRSKGSPGNPSCPPRPPCASAPARRSPGSSSCGWRSSRCDPTRGSCWASPTAPSDPPSTPNLH
ncbi:hypothetical protein RLOC_00004594 [Lonchura striata]|uniref:Uncharacterized protein n=1 Tax=Lonchura striata TaxID=40157 RepID=A0A218U983_9PASE|nr:hypothetical protein RLOC_00004594 [Lonchura striata domestica]